MPCCLLGGEVGPHLGTSSPLSSSSPAFPRRPGGLGESPTPRRLRPYVVGSLVSWLSNKSRRCSQKRNSFPADQQPFRLAVPGRQRGKGSSGRRLLTKRSNPASRPALPHILWSEDHAHPGAPTRTLAHTDTHHAARQLPSLPGPANSGILALRSHTSHRRISRAASVGTAAVGSKTRERLLRRAPCRASPRRCGLARRHEHGNVTRRRRPLPFPRPPSPTDRPLPVATTTSAEDDPAESRIGVV